MKTQKRTKGVRTLLIVILVLTFTIAILGYINAGDLEQKRELEMSAAFLLIHGEHEYRITMESLLVLEPVDFRANLKTSGAEPIPTDFTGIELRTLCQAHDITLAPNSVIQIKALDGYVSALGADEVLIPDNVYLCIFMNGEPLKPKKENGFGPYMVVLKNEPHSQRWCKFVEQIIVP